MKLLSGEKSGEKRNLKYSFRERTSINKSERHRSSPDTYHRNGNLVSTCYVESVVSTIVLDIPFFLSCLKLRHEYGGKISNYPKPENMERLKAISKTNIQRLILCGEKKKSVPDTWLFELI